MPSRISMNLCKIYHLVAMVTLSSILAQLNHVEGHGYLAEPPARSSMWKFGFSTPVNYNHMELFCGGFSVQWEQNGGRCGVCGDAWHLPTPRPHEAGGLYGTDTISRRYSTGSIVEITVQITAFHKGYFEFRICPVGTGRNADATHECLNRNLLQLADGSGTRYQLPSNGGSRAYKVKVRLPKGLQCQHCVLQWKYNTGNSWGTDSKTGQSCLGCGPQEQFYGCADVSIRN